MAINEMEYGSVPFTIEQMEANQDEDQCQHASCLKSEVNLSLCLCVCFISYDGRRGEGMFVIESLQHLQYLFLLPVCSITVWFSYSECHINNAEGDDIDLCRENSKQKCHMGLE